MFPAGFVYNEVISTFHYHFLKTNRGLDKVADQMREIFDTAAKKVITLTEPVETD